MMRMMMKSHFLKRCSLSERLKNIDLVFQHDLKSLDIIQLNKIDTIEGLLGSLLVFKGLVKKRPWPCEMKSTFTCNLFSSA